MSKIIKCFLFAIVSLCGVKGYNQVITKYFDSNWHETPKEKAYYYETDVKDGNHYSSSSYWSDSNQLYAKYNYSDSAFSRAIGTGMKYYRSGRTKDSLVYTDSSSNLVSLDRFTEEGGHDFHAFYDEKENNMKGERFDANGNKIPGYFIYRQPAVFPGGLQAWVQYLQTHLKADVPRRKRAPVGNYIVMVSFLVDKQGNIYEVKAENDPGYGTAEEAVRVIKTGPAWVPAKQEDKPVIYRQRQPITFQVANR